MASLAFISLNLIGLALFAVWAAFGVSSLVERDRRAAAVSFALALTSSAPFVASSLLSEIYRVGVMLAVAVATLVIVVVWCAPIGEKPEASGRPKRRVDERDIMFARARLKPGSPEYASYYAMRPENKAKDDRTRALPGLLSPDAQMAEFVAFASANACFEMTKAMREMVDGPVSDQPREGSVSASTELVKRLALHYGARSVGVAKVRPYHVYSHVGRGTGIYGEPIILDHEFAIAFTVEMNYDVMRSAPAAPVVAESARQYVESAKIAVQLAEVIRSIGYPARAHIDGNYRVIAPLVALDAGLGEIGRMGLLMTPRGVPEFD
ncbi:MAG: hypothetical protein JSV80_05950 [Acidobacteriota bacterium]|nr:MAG: hypothetical protein JSV80_05950 [Acidobacteriota bacterium]